MDISIRICGSRTYDFPLPHIDVLVDNTLAQGSSTEGESEPNIRPIVVVDGLTRRKWKLRGVLPSVSEESNGDSEGLRRDPKTSLIVVIVTMMCLMIKGHFMVILHRKGRGITFRVMVMVRVMGKVIVMVRGTVEVGIMVRVNATVTPKEVMYCFEILQFLHSQSWPKPISCDQSNFLSYNIGSKVEKAKTCSMIVLY